MDTIGVVKSIEKDRAIVKVARTSACGGNCASCNICGNRELETSVKNTVGAKEGDVVKITTSSGRVLFSAFVLYVLPILLFLIFYLLSSRCFSVPITLSISLLAVGVLYLAIRKWGKSLAVESEITEIIKENMNE